MMVAYLLVRRFWHYTAKVNEMCLAIPGKVDEIDGNIATVDIMGVKNRIAIDMVRNVQIGDYLMIHAGYAIEKIDETEAIQTIELFHELGGLISKDDV